MLAILFFLMLGMYFFHFYNVNNSISKAYVYVFVLASAYIFCSANLLSVFRLYNEIGVFVTLILSLGFISYILMKNSHKQISHTSFFSDKIANIFLVFFLLFSVLTIVRALSFPPENNDSLTYSLPRAFYYYKLGKVTNIPSNYIIFNYSGPANSIFVSYWFILSGEEVGANLIQFPSLVIVFFVTYLISLELECKRQTAIVIAAIAGTLPLVLLQGATTQNDLLTASYAISAVYFMYSIYNRDSSLDALCLGICVGGVFLSKISSAAVLVPFGIVYLSVVLFKRKQISMILLNALGCIMVTCSFWYRNAIDNAGDFLALNASNYLNQGQSFSIVDHIGGIIISIGYCCSGYVGFFNRKWLNFLRIVYNKIGAKEYGRWEYYMIVPRPNHDFYPYGIALVVGIVCLLLVLLKKKYSPKQKWYCVLSLVALMFSAAIMPMFFAQSVTRYMMGAILLVIVPISIVMENIDNKFFRSIGCLFLGGMILVNGVWTNFYDQASPLIEVLDTKYEEKRDTLTPRSMSWALVSKEVKEEIDLLGANRIGIWEEELTHIYSMLHELMPDEYDVRSVEGVYAQGYKESFDPQVILYAGKDLEKSVFLENKEYRLYKEIEQTFINGCKAGIYIE